jgi:CBS domain-containing protein
MKTHVREIMTPHLITCPEDTPVQEIVKTLRDRGIGAVVILDKEGKPEGIVSETDILEIVAREQYLDMWKHLKARHLMTRELLTIPQDAPIQDAAAMMERFRVHRLVVVDDEGQPIGVVAMSDVIRYLADREEEAHHDQ